MGGYSDASSGRGASWVPVSDAANDWAQTSRGTGACARRSDMEEYAPDGAFDAGSVSAVACCFSDDYLNGIDPSTNYVGDAEGTFVGWSE